MGRHVVECGIDLPFLLVRRPFDLNSVPMQSIPSFLTVFIQVQYCHVENSYTSTLFLVIEEAVHAIFGDEINVRSTYFVEPSFPEVIEV